MCRGERNSDSDGAVTSQAADRWGARRVTRDSPGLRRTWSSLRVRLAPSELPRSLRLRLSAAGSGGPGLTAGLAALKLTRTRQGRGGLDSMMWTRLGPGPGGRRRAAAAAPAAGVARLGPSPGPDSEPKPASALRHRSDRDGGPGGAARSLRSWHGYLKPATPGLGADINLKLRPPLPFTSPSHRTVLRVRGRVTTVSNGPGGLSASGMAGPGPALRLTGTESGSGYGPYSRTFKILTQPLPARAAAGPLRVRVSGWLVTVTQSGPRRRPRPRPTWVTLRQM